MTSITGDSVKNKASDSSVSTTINSPAPSRAFAPALLSRPPMTKVGSRPPSDSARHDDGVRAFDMRRIVTVRNARAQTGQPFGCRIANQIGAADAVAQIQQHFGDATHAGASDADKM